MWRYDAGRNAATPQQLPYDLHLQWVREYPRLEPVWDDPLNRDIMHYDAFYEPVVYGQTLFLGSNAFDRMIAIDTVSGEEKWAYYVEGPVRFPPVVDNGKVYFVSDDGWLYCLSTDQGELVWKYRGVPKDRLLLGNKRIISTWCARGGPVIKDGIVYFGAGIWPFMGVFLFAIDAETGQEIWVNDGVSSTYIKQPHNSPSFAGIAPQGSFVIAGDKLLVPGGRSVPACFDLKTGEFQYYRLADSGKTGGAFVSATKNHFVNYYRDKVVDFYDLKTGDRLIGAMGKMPVLTEDAFYCRGEKITALDYTNFTKKVKEEIITDEETDEVTIKKTTYWEIKSLWEIDIDASGDLIKAGDRLFAGGAGVVSAIDLPYNQAAQPAASWQSKIEGTVARLVAADDKLFVVTIEGLIYAFGADPVKAQNHPYIVKTNQISPVSENRANEIIKAAQTTEGYCLVYGAEDGDFLEALVRNSAMNVIAMIPDAAIVDALRRRFAASGLYGERLSIRVGNISSLSMPQYLASLIIIDEKDTSGAGQEKLIPKMFDQLRPYGGVACIQVEKVNMITAIKSIQQCKLPKAKICQSNEYLLVKREGALLGSASWTHQYGDVANTVKSDDERVKLPLGLLWFGGSSNMDVLPRHGHGPPEQVIGGRLFIEGMDSLSARDVYTGRVLWKRILPKLGTEGIYFDDTYKDTPLSTAYNQIHIPGANARGANFVATHDKIYIIHDEQCLALDPATGETITTLSLPDDFLIGPAEKWGYLGVYKDYLIAGAGLVKYTDFIEVDPETASKKLPFVNYDNSASKRLVVMNRHSGEVIWSFNSDLGLRHNAIVAGNNTIFCIDKMPAPAEKTLKRRGKKYIGTPRLLAFDISNGNIRWSSAKNVFGTWLGYSEENDILIQSGRYSRDMLNEEPEGMAGYQGADGAPLWETGVSSGGPSILHHKTIISGKKSYSLLTGEIENLPHPITGEEIDWKFFRNYGCNYAIACENLMTFRSAAAGFFDLTQFSGTGNFGGFKSSCTSNLIAADGVLNAPDYTRTCSCSYQNQTSLALAHDPEVETWTFNDIDLGEGNIKRLGINLGAPGDRRTEDGTLWLEYPYIGGPSPDIKITTSPEKSGWFHHHSVRMNDGAVKWIASSGAQGLRRIVIPVGNPTKDDLRYMVKLHFSEPETIEVGDRVFNLSINGEQVLKDFDVLHEAGAIRTGIIRKFNNIPITKDLVIELAPSSSAPNCKSVLCGIELVSVDYSIPGEAVILGKN